MLATGAVGEPKVSPASMPNSTAPLPSTVSRVSPLDSFNCPPWLHLTTAPLTRIRPIS